MTHEKLAPSQALVWCRYFLHGAWSTSTIEDMTVERVPGGLSNYLYCCSLSNNVKLHGHEPRRVLLRIYGETHTKHRGTLLTDSIVCTLLSERKLGPHVYGIFPEGRIEEFVDGESLSVSEIRDPKISRKLGHLLSKIHELYMPLVKEPIWLFHSIERVLSDLPADVHRFEKKEDRVIFQELRSVCNFHEEFVELQKILSTIESPVCFTHNDFQPGNILRLKSDPNNLTVIDFEYCSYNHRGFDIGNHFCEFMFDYKSSKEWPFFYVNFTLYPDRVQQINFLSSYADSIISTRQQSGDLVTNEEFREELISQLLKEANYFALASHFFWALWAINMAASTTITFGYMAYARSRLTSYYLMRHFMIGANEMPPSINEDRLLSEKNPFNKSYKKTNLEQSTTE